MNKFKKSYLILRTLLVSILSLIILIAATGFSYSVHYCHGSQTNVQIFPELIQSQSGCGCELSQKDVDRKAESESHGVIQKTKCCKNLHYFRKVQLLSFELQKKEITFHSLQLLFAITFDLFSSQPNAGFQESHQKPGETCDLPSGKSWILSHHQMRIPSPSSDC